MQNPYEIALIHRVKAEIRKNMDFNPKLKGVFEGYLTGQVIEYCNRGIKMEIYMQSYGSISQI